MRIRFRSFLQVYLLLVTLAMGDIALAAADPIVLDDPRLIPRRIWQIGLIVLAVLVILRFALRQGKSASVEAIEQEELEMPMAEENHAKE